MSKIILYDMKTSIQTISSIKENIMAGLSEFKIRWYPWIRSVTGEISVYKDQCGRIKCSIE